jgi:hypothetical protein
MLNIWPELPIYVYYDDSLVEDTDNAITALKLRGSISTIDLTISQAKTWERIVAVMQDPFPILEDLYLWLDEVIPDSFLGGSAPRLKYLTLDAITFPALPNLLLSATDLVDLRLLDIPHSGYISPEVMVTSISGLTRLESLSLHFRSPRSHPDRADQFLPRSTRTLFPALTHLDFKGVTEYLEDLVARIDVPLLQSTDITFFNQLVFDISQFPNLIYRTEKLTVIDKADVVLNPSSIVITLSPKGGSVDSMKLKLEISCTKFDWQLSALAQVCNSCLVTLSGLERLSVCDGRYKPQHWQDDIENTQWIELLRPFATVKDLYLSDEVALRVAPALQELSEEWVTEVLPALRDIFIDGFEPSGLVQEGFQKFITARGQQVSSRPVAIHRWVREEEPEEEEDWSWDWD